MKKEPKGLAATLITLFFLAACASRTQEASPRSDPNPLLTSYLSNSTADGTFPIPSGLEPQIAFWSTVYGTWNLGQVALHDAKYLNLVYDVIDLPSPVDDSYADEQREFVRARYETLKMRLRELELKVAMAESLSPPEQALASLIKASAGAEALVGAADRLRSQRGLRERFKRGLEISKRYDAMFRAIFKEAGLPEDLAYLPHVESSFQAHARSSAGAVGIWQFTRSAARIYLNNHPALDERLDPVAAARGAARYLRDAFDTLGSWPLAITSYNHGINGMARAKQSFGNDFMNIVRYYDYPSFGFASRNFYAEFLAAREVASHPERFFPEGLHYQAPLNWDRVVLNQPTSASELAGYYGIERQELIAMNLAWTQYAASDRIALPEGTEVWLPAGTLAQIAQFGPRKPESRLALADKARKTVQR
jgi:membrane-bound lytic murein transglycosylase D